MAVIVNSLAVLSQVNISLRLFFNKVSNLITISVLLHLSNFEFFLSVVINCPRDNKYTVMLTEMMTNTTLPEIVNEIKGSDDTVVTDDSQ